MSQRAEIRGEVAPGFEPVAALFEKNMNTFFEDNAQLCVYIGEDRVVDLWASTTRDPEFSPDSLVNIFSSGKSLEAITLAMLLDRGLISYEARIVDYWPEFGKNDKHDLTVADLMRHEAGMSSFDTSINPEDLLPENIKQNRIGNLIENETLKFRSGTDSPREYHALTRGWIVNEVFRRVDPQQRTMGEFLHQEVSGPLAADTMIGLPRDALDRRSALAPFHLGLHLRESLKPRFMGRRVLDNVFHLTGKLAPLVSGFRSGSRTGAPLPFEGMPGFDVFNEDVIAMGETPSANTHSSARGLARIAAAMAQGGSLGGVKLLSDTAWQAMHAEPLTRSMGMRTSFTQGGVNLFTETAGNAMPIEKALNRGREGFYGWMGLGGSIFQWHPEKQIGFAFVPTSLHVLDLVNARGKQYQQAVVDCLPH